jgi:hypothetical protein
MNPEASQSRSDSPLLIVTTFVRVADDNMNLNGSVFATALWSNHALLGTCSDSWQCARKPHSWDILHLTVTAQSVAPNSGVLALQLERYLSLDSPGLA